MATATPPENNGLIWLIVGLGNPGSTYLGTRHNVGLEVIDLLADRHDIGLGKAPKRAAANVGRGHIDRTPVVLVAPTTFMNESGAAVQPIARYFSVEAERIVVVHDDIDTPFGKIKVQHSRGTGGHNGVASVAARMGGSEFWRIKIGVGRPPGRQDPADFVLRRFSGEERADMDYVVQIAADVIERLVSDGAEAARQLAGSTRL
ncbi:MAG: aminoacyl-tRNA hydrolase [Acidimicrobiia bacterium]|nr:aminoacyl-tRNA hydrolase [Acidimicrobiia bacterium]